MYVEVSSINMELVTLSFGGGWYMPVIDSDFLFTLTFYVMYSNALFLPEARVVTSKVFLHTIARPPFVSFPV